MAPSAGLGHGHGHRPLLLLAAILGSSLFAVLYSLTSFATLPKQLEVEQQCRMSRMYPAYIDYTDSLEHFSSSGLWRKYRLFLYRERTVEPWDMPTGSPALFVPGNAGSYGQVRSVASSAARQWFKQGAEGARMDEWKNVKFPSAHTDWWTVDFNEDFSAFSGSTLIQQATFLNEVVAFLQNRYPSPKTRTLLAGERNVTVPILAHSMGGISSRLMATLDNYRPDSIDTIVTLSTPHAYPPVPFDKSIEKVYRSINRPASSFASEGATGPLLISIAGGLLDSQLPSDPASLSLAEIHQRSPASRMSSFTSSLPSLWSSVDHLAIMWCDQLREKIARGFILDVAEFGRLADDRKAGGLHGKGSVLRRRRELWRRVLGISQQADGGAVHHVDENQHAVEVEALGEEPEEEVHVEQNESPRLTMEVNGDKSVLRTSPSDSVYHRPASDSEGGELAFELVTNMCIGANPSAGTGPPIPQPVELIVLVCRRGMDPAHPIKLSRAVCEPILPWRWELMPPSGLPDAKGHDSATGDDRYPTEFPDAHKVYHVPGQSFARLRLDSKTLKEKEVEFIRLERKADDGITLQGSGRHSFTRAGWIREVNGEVTQSRGVSTLHPRNPTSHEHPVVMEWAVPRMSSALLAHDIELVPSKCFLKNVARNAATFNHQPSGSRIHDTPAFAPIIRISDPATGDARWFPSLVPPAFVQSLSDARKTHHGDNYAIRRPFALHGGAPFMPPPRTSNHEVHMQLWVDPVLLRQPNKPGDVCPAPFDSITVRTNWRASVGLVVMRYRFFVAAWPLAFLSCVVAKMWYDWTHAAGPLALRFPSILDHLTSAWTIKKLLPLSIGALAAADLLQRCLYFIVTSGDATEENTSSSLVGALAGMPQPVGLAPFLIAALVMVSYQVLLSIALVIHHALGLASATLVRFGLASKVAWGPPPAAGLPPRFRPASLAGLAALLLSVVLFVPHQFVFLVLCLLHVGNTLRSRIEMDRTVDARLTETAGQPLPSGHSRRKASEEEQVASGSGHDIGDGDGDGDNNVSRVDGYLIPERTSSAFVTAGGMPAISSAALRSRYNQHLTLLLVLLLVLPQKVTVLVVWARNLAAVGLVTPHTSASWTDHNPLDVLPILLISWVFAGGRALEPPRRTWIETRIPVLLWAAMGASGLVWGIRYTYSLYEALLWTTMGLVLLHWRARTAAATTEPGAAGRYEPVRTDEAPDGDGSAFAMQDRTGRGAPARKEASPSIPIHHLALPNSATVAATTAIPAETAFESLREPEGQRSSSPSELASPSGPESAAAPRSATTAALDDLLTSYLTTLDTYHHLRTQSATAFASGFLYLGKAKLELGHARLSQDAYDGRLLPELRSEVDELGRVTVRRVSPSYEHLFRNGEGEAGVLLDAADSPNTSAEKDDVGLRHRRRGAPREDALASSAPAQDHDEKVTKPKHPAAAEANKRVRPPHALYQFSALPCPSLRTAQSEFGKAVGVALAVDRGQGDEGLVDVLRRLGMLEAQIRKARASQLGRDE